MRKKKGRKKPFAKGESRKEKKKIFKTGKKYRMRIRVARKNENERERESVN